jgi:hypothetical protein
MVCGGYISIKERMALGLGVVLMLAVGMLVVPEWRCWRLKCRDIPRRQITFSLTLCNVDWIISSAVHSAQELMQPQMRTTVTSQVRQFTTF